MERKALILGATGGFGAAAAAALLRHGWTVAGMARDPEKASTRLPGISWRGGDASKPEDTRAAAKGTAVIVHAVNPPGYRNWGALVLPMIDATILAAKAAGARIMLPGTVYNYGPDAFPILSEDSPQHPLTEKGRIRVELERRLQAASREGARALILRCGDFFGPAPGNSWFTQALVKPGTRLARISNPGRKNTGHAWAYLPDAATAMARLLDREQELEDFASFHFQGVWDADGTAMIRAIRSALGRPVKLARFPWPLVALAGLVQETPREIYKMRYLWRNAVRLENRKLVAFLGEEPHTPVEQAVRATLAANGIH